jgi:outer membrane lipase/esterase
MKKLTALTVALLAAIIPAGAARAVSLGHYSSLVILGDSLSDPGNLFAATGGTTPANPPYPDGSFTNEDVWGVAVADRFTAKGLLAKNFAYGGANALPEDDGVPDLDAQASFVLGIPDAALGRAPVVALWFGANDGILALNEGLDIEATAIAAANAVADASLFLSAAKDIGTFALFNLPDLGLTPRYRFSPETGLAEKATLYTDTFNAMLAERSGGLRGLGLDILEIDINTPYKAAVADPASLGLVSSALPCVLVPTVSPACSTDEAKLLMFFDPIHPNSVIHAEIAGIVSAQIAPVPLPAPFGVLRGGIAGVGVAGRRRVRA